MASFFRTLFDEIIEAFGGSYDKPPKQQLKPDSLPPLDVGQQCSFHGLPIDPATHAS